MKSLPTDMQCCLITEAQYKHGNDYTFVSYCYDCYRWMSETGTPWASFLTAYFTDYLHKD